MAIDTVVPQPAGPRDRGQGFEDVEYSQDRDYTWRTGLQRRIFLGDDAERSIREAIPFSPVLHGQV